MYGASKNSNRYIDNHKFHAILYIDYKFTNEEKDYIIQSASNWETATNSAATFEFVYLPTQRQINLDKGILVLKVDSLDTDIITLDVNSENHMNTLGVCQKYKTVPYIKIVGNRMTYDIYEAVITHELGHLIGLSHNRKPNTLMYPTTDLGASKITDDDVKNFCKLYNCK